MKSKFIYESIESFLEPKSNEDIKKELSKLSKSELNDMLFTATYNGENSRKIKLLIDAGADVNNDDGFIDSTPLMNASQYGYKDIVKLILDSGADVNAKDNDGWTALMYASNNGHEEVIKMLINSGAYVNDKDNKGFTALHYASSNSSIDIIKFFKQHGAKYNNY